MEEYTIKVWYMPHLVDMKTYAKLCGINKRGLQKRMREKRVAYVVIDGLILFDTIASPPVKKLPYRYRPGPFVINNDSTDLKKLVRVSTVAQKNGITSDRFYRYALLGRLPITMIMGEAFIYNTNMIDFMLKDYSKDVNYTPVG